MKARTTRRVLALALAFAFAFAASVLLSACAGSSTPRRDSPPAHERRLVAIGDSIPYGAQDCHFCTAFPELFGRAITSATRIPVRVDNRAEHTGITSTDLRKEILTGRELRAAVAAADIVLVTIGHNDTPWNREDDPCDGRANGLRSHWCDYRGTCLRDAARDYSRNLDRILGEIEKLRRGRSTVLRVTDDYNDVLGEPSAPRRAASASRRVLDVYSRSTCEVARRHHGRCIDTYHAFNGPRGSRDAGPLLSFDHTHPSAEGHKRIAELLAAAGFGP